MKRMDEIRLIMFNYYQQFHVGVPNLEDKGAQNIHSKTFLWNCQVKRTGELAVKRATVAS